MLALSSWVWVAAAGLALVALGILIRVTLGLVGRLKDLNRTLRAASGQLNEALDEMRADLDRVSDGLGTLRERRDRPAGRL